MSRLFSVIAVVGGSLALSPSVWGADAGRRREDEPARVAARIDRALQRVWQSRGVLPAEPTGDAEFFRRVSLDLTGKVPPVAEVRRFLADASPDKRTALVERLLQSPTHAASFAVQWRQLLAPDAEDDATKQAALTALDAWLRRQIATNVPYDRWVHELLTFPTDGGPADDPAAPSPRLFYAGREDKPEELAAATCRLFLGLRLECAQCHDHPFATWKRDQFWGQAAFFGGLRRPGVRTVAIPGTQRTAAARFLDGKVSVDQGDARAQLAAWITDADNPYFAPAVVNRLWAHFFGVGLVDPVDDFGPENPPSHPRVLDELARAFVASGYDLRFLMRVLTDTRAYHLSSVTPDGKPAQPRLFSRMNVKGLTPEQLFDSLVEASGLRGPQLPRLRARFLTRFPRSEGRLEARTSTPQALALMNGELLAAAVDPAGDTTLGAVVASPFLTTAEKIETLYLAALGRLPRDAERRRYLAYVEKGGMTGTQSEALSDVFWTLLNSPEFLFNH
jgi:hypothetical protein